MKNIFKRAVAMLLCAVMIFGILPSNLSTVFAASDVTSSEVTGNLLTEAKHNYNFENSLLYNASKPKGWTPFKTREWSSYELVQRAPGDSALKVTITDGGLNSGATGTNATYALYSEAIEVDRSVGKDLVVEVDAKIASGTPNLNVNVFFYTNDNKPTEMASSGVEGQGLFALTNLVTDEWGTISSSQLGKNQTVLVPAGAKYARIFLYFSCKNVGEIHIDNVVLKDPDGVDSSWTCPDVPEFVEYDWEIVETSHPRVYFNSDELDQIKKFTGSSTLNAVGYSGSKA